MKYCNDPWCWEWEWRRENVTIMRRLEDGHGRQCTLLVSHPCDSLVSRNFTIRILVEVYESMAITQDSKYLLTEGIEECLIQIQRSIKHNLLAPHCKDIDI